MGAAAQRRPRAGLKWADQSITTQKTFNNLRTKAAILEKQGDTAQAEALRATR
jgi:hypothetical protein